MDQLTESDHLIYVVDDDVDISRLVTRHLGGVGYRVKQFSSGQEALATFKSDEPALIILDIVMPRLNGLDVARIIRQDSGVPIIMLSVRHEMSVKLVGLGIGADDYVTKPFQAEELLARVRAILRRSIPGRPNIRRKTYRFGDLLVDLEGKRVISVNQTINLTPREWALLEVLVRHAGQIVSPHRILQETWGPCYGDKRDYVRAYIRRLRLKLEPEPQSPRFVLLARGFGYYVPESD